MAVSWMNTMCGSVYVCQRERDGANADCGICIQSGASEMEAVTADDRRVHAPNAWLE